MEWIQNAEDSGPLAEQEIAHLKEESSESSSPGRSTAQAGGSLKAAD